MYELISFILDYIYEGLFFYVYFTDGPVGLMIGFAYLVKEWAYAIDWWLKKPKAESNLCGSEEPHFIREIDTDTNIKTRNWIVIEDRNSWKE